MTSLNDDHFEIKTRVLLLHKTSKIPRATKIGFIISLILNLRFRIYIGTFSTRWRFLEQLELFRVYISALGLK